MQHEATIRFEPSCTIQRIPRCPACLSANPQALKKCWNCGEAQPAPDDPIHVADVTATLPPNLFPWYARLLLRIGAALRSLSKRIGP